MPKITEWREDPTITERTLAAFVSGAKTKVHINKAADNPSLNGMYVPDTDSIYLFKCKGKIPAVCVALEEAGHSLERQTYLDHTGRARRVREQLEAWDPQAPGLLDWYEDGRIYENLKTEYPGARTDLDYVWEKREESLVNLAWDTRKVLSAEELEMIKRRKELADEFVRSVERYKTGNSFKTFPEILDYLEKFSQTKPQDQPVSTGMTILVVGKNGGQKFAKGMKMLHPGDKLPMDTMVVVIDMDGRAAGFGATHGDYSWQVLRTDELEIDGEDALW